MWLSFYDCIVMLRTYVNFLSSICLTNLHNICWVSPCPHLCIYSHYHACRVFTCAYLLIIIFAHSILTSQVKLEGSIWPSMMKSHNISVGGFQTIRAVLSRMIIRILELFCASLKKKKKPARSKTWKGDLGKN